RKHYEICIFYSCKTKNTKTTAYTSGSVPLAVRHPSQTSASGGKTWLETLPKMTSSFPSTPKVFDPYTERRKKSRRNQLCDV
ncbi:MAG: hypothetical protein AAF348_19760, partial [Bacteroidota bacterium]